MSGTEPLIFSTSFSNQRLLYSALSLLTATLVLAVSVKTPASCVAPFFLLHCTSGHQQTLSTLPTPVLPFWPKPLSSLWIIMIILPAAILVLFLTTSSRWYCTNGHMVMVFLRGSPSESAAVLTVTYRTLHPRVPCWASWISLTPSLLTHTCHTSLLVVPCTHQEPLTQNLCSCLCLECLSGIYLLG